LRIFLDNKGVGTLWSQFKAKLAVHADDSNIHVTAEEKAAWDGKAELTDIPTSLPANGGNADTVGNLPASSFLGSSTNFNYHFANGAGSDAISRVKEEAHIFAFNFTDTPTAYGFLDVSSFDGEGFAPTPFGLVRQVWTDWANPSERFVRIYKATSETDGVWTDWSRCNADTLGGKHADDFIYARGYLNGIDLDDIKYPCSGLAINCVHTPSDQWGTLLVYAGGTGSFTQIYVPTTASDGTPTAMYFRHYSGTGWTTWCNTADGGNAATVNGYTVNANVPAGFSSIGQNTENKTYTYEGKTYTGSNTSEVFNDYANNEAAGTHSHAEGYHTKALKSYSHAEGSNTTASGNYSHAEGGGTTASGGSSHAEGNSTKASSMASHAEGSNTTASGYSSHVEGGGTKTSGGSSHAEGSGTTASGEASHAEGNSTTASSYASHAGGKYNKAMTNSTSAKDNTGDSFVIGNGTSADALSNAFRVTYGGAVYGLSAFNSSGADYAEFIKPWADGNPDNEDRVGYMVTIKNGLLHKANEGDYIVGITSGNPSVVGNADEDYYWRYERDEFNRFVYEDAEEEVEQLDDDGAPMIDENGMPVMIKTGNIIKNAHYKLAADYDSKKQNDYIERKNRPEWSYVGMIGVIPVRDDGTCEAGCFCKCGQNGIATRAESRGFDTFFVIERISDNVVSVEIR
jgi:hypothetical protein